VVLSSGSLPVESTNALGPQKFHTSVALPILVVVFKSARSAPGHGLRTRNWALDILGVSPITPEALQLFSVGFQRQRRVGRTVSQGKGKTRLFTLFDFDRRRRQFTWNAEGIQRPNHDDQATHRRRSQGYLRKLLTETCCDFVEVVQSHPETEN